jgi:hypothetical protein
MAISRSEFVFYGVMSLLFAKVTQWFIEPWAATMLPFFGFAESAMFGGVAWVISAIVVFFLLHQIKNRGKERE